MPAVVPAQVGQEVAADEFVYQSRTAADGSTVAFGGRVRVVPGSLREPTGEAFDVVVEHIELITRPDFIF